MCASKPGKDPIRHHYVPRFLLENFTGANGKLWVYDSKGEKRFATTPEKTGYESNLYATTTSRGEIERQFARVFDEPGAIAIRALLAKQTLDGETAAQFMGFVAAQMQRTPLRLELMDAQIAPVLQESYQRMAKHDESFRRGVTEGLKEIGVSPEEIENDLTNAANGMHSVKPTKEHALMMALMQIPKIHEEICKMKWMFLDLHPEDPDLLIGDHPVMLHDATKNADGSPLPLGLRNDRIEIVMPLSRRVVAMAHWHGPRGYGQGVLGLAGETNELSMRYARRFVFGSASSDELMQQMIERRGTGPKVRTRRVRQGNSTFIISEYS